MLAIGRGGRTGVATPSTRRRSATAPASSKRPPTRQGHTRPSRSASRPATETAGFRTSSRAARPRPSSSPARLSSGSLGAAGHQPDELGLVDLALGVRAQHLPAVEDDEAIADGVGVMGVVRDEDHGHAALPRLQHVAQHDAGLLDAERRGGLVQDQDTRAEVDGAGAPTLTGGPSTRRGGG